MKPCPFCNELIPEEAGQCPACHQDLPDPAGVLEPSIQSETESRLPDPFAVIAFVFSLCGVMLLGASFLWVEYFPDYLLAEIALWLLTGLLANPFPLASLVFGVLALKRISAGQFQRGKKLAVASLILAVAVLFCVILFSVLIILARNSLIDGPLLFNVQKFIIFLMGS